MPNKTRKLVLAFVEAPALVYQVTYLNQSKILKTKNNRVLRVCDICDITVKITPVRHLAAVGAHDI